MLKKRVIGKNILFALFLSLVIVGAIIVSMHNSNTAQNTAQKKPNHKTIIIFVEALPYYIIDKNINYLPTIKSLCESASCGAMQPFAPTFTTMQLYGIETGELPNQAQYAYNFFPNTTSLENGKCAFVGELNILGYPWQPSLQKTITSSKQYAKMTKFNKAETLFRELPNVLKNYDVIYASVQDTDSHDLDLSDTSPNSPIMKRLKKFDINLNNLIQSLKKENLYNNTTIILFGDHGMASIHTFPLLPDIISELSQQVDISNLCYWNDAGTSIRFWFLPNATGKDGIKQKIDSYFKTKTSCFFVVDDGYLQEKNLLFEKKEKNWINFGDIHIGVKVGCKVNTKQPQGGMESFEFKQHEVDTFISMHGYLDNMHPQLQSFVIIKEPLKKQDTLTNFTILDLREKILEEALE